jgi:hypothetical protein
MQEVLKLALAVLGSTVVFSFLLTALKGFYARLLRGGKNLKLQFGVWGM